MKWQSELTLVAIVGLLTTPSMAGDWPQFRYDAGRTAAAPDELPAELQLRWTRTMPQPQPAFPQEVRLAYDVSYEPTVLGHTMFVPSMVTDSITALETETGAERWRFIAEGPVRFAPAVGAEKVYCASDDGYLYCLNAADGTLKWKFRGLPEGRKDRKILGNGRLISLWPARGGPVLVDGTVYFAAGLWPTEGVFVHALDAETGNIIWSNTTGDRIQESNWDHGQGQLAGLTPQGYLTVVGDRLIVPCGAQLPAFLDRKTGKILTYTTGWGGRIGLPKGCWFVAGIGNYLSHAGDLYDIARPNEERLANADPNARNFKPMLYPGGFTRLDIAPANQRELDSFCQPVLTPDVMYESGTAIVARSLAEVALQERTKDNIPAHRGKDELPDNTGGILRQRWELPSGLEVHIKAGNRLYVGGPGIVEAIGVTASAQPNVVWRGEFAGTPTRMLAADNRLFVVTAEGSMHAFAAPQPGEVVKHAARGGSPSSPDEWTERAKAILNVTGVRDGYALVLGIDNGRLIDELVEQSSLHVIAVDGDAGRVAAAREHLCAAGRYGTRACVLAGDPVTYPFPPYLANLVVSETPGAIETASTRSLVGAVFHTLRPYGGVACAWGPPAVRDQLEGAVQGIGLPDAHVRQAGDMVLLTRSGGLPGAADWSHAEANAASTGTCEDEFIRAPVSVLWFDAAQRWHKYPGQNQVRIAGGRLVLHEENLLRASDVFTGRTLWEVDLSKDSLDRKGIRYARHRQWGPTASPVATTELVAVEDAIYLGDGTTCLIFDPATGKAAGTIALPEDLKSPWANLRICDDQLVGTSGPTVLCADRRTGQVRWRAEASRSALYLAVGGGKVFCAELTDPKRGEDETRDGVTFALQLATGERIWQRAGGGRLRYSPSLDVVVTAAARYRGSNGEPLAAATAGPLVLTGGGLPKSGLPGLIAGRKLLTGNDETLAVYDLQSGEPLGEPLKWSRRGCTGPRASTHLLTTRFHANSAWIDLDRREITAFLGIRPGCSVNNNLYPADGVLNMPNLTGGCTCNYAPVSMACVPAGVIERSGAP